MLNARDAPADSDSCQEFLRGGCLQDVVIRPRVQPDQNFRRLASHCQQYHVGEVRHRQALFRAEAVSHRILRSLTIAFTAHLPDATRVVIVARLLAGMLSGNHDKPRRGSRTRELVTLTDVTPRTVAAQRRRNSTIGPMTCSGLQRRVWAS